NVISGSNATIPKCDAVTSLGEPLNYLNSGRLLQRTIKKVYAALRKDGLFIFDVRHPPLRAIESINHVKSGKDWFCHALIEEDSKQLVRHITTFRKVGKHFRREQETHRLKLYSKQKMLEWLRNVGFRVRAYRGYGAYVLTKRQSVFVCRKP
ncbi:MAG: class I SAM-dependent methyltransferase, partial [Planctomycetota bacterium]